MVEFNPLPTCRSPIMGSRYVVAWWANSRLSDIRLIDSGTSHICRVSETSIFLEPASGFEPLTCALQVRLRRIYHNPWSLHGCQKRQ